jgi:hypothetical protein
MASDSDIELILDISTKAAEVALANFAQSAPRQVEVVEKSFFNMGNVIKGAFAYLSAREVLRGFDAITEAASENERALTQLNVALKLSGDFSEAASAQFQAFAANMQKSTVYTDELILQNVALAKSFNVSNTQAQKMVQAAADLSAATGVSLNEAVSQLGKTLDGTAGRLNETIPALRNLTATQLQAGAAIDYVATRFHGAADAIGGTFSGELIKTKNQFGELQETLGTYITQNTVVLTAISKARDLFIGLNETLKNNDQTISKMVKGAITGLITAGGFLLKMFVGIDFTISKSLELVQYYVAFFSNLPGVIGAAIDAIKSRSFKPLTDLDKKISDEAGAHKSGFEDRLKLYDEIINKVEDYGKAIEKTEAKQLKSTKLASDALKNQQKIAEQLSRTQRESLISQFQSNPFGGLFGQVDTPRGTTNTDRSIGFGAGIFQGVAQGGAGAIKLAGNLAGAGANALFTSLPGIGAAIGPVIEFLAQGPEKVKETIKEFIKSIPVIIKNIIESIPEVIIALAEAIPDAINQFMDDLPSIMDRLADKIPEVVAKLAAEMPNFSNRLAIAFIRNLPSIAKSFIDSIIHEVPRMITEVIKEFSKQISGITGGLGKSLSGVAGGAGAFGQAGAVLGSAFGPVGGVVGGVVGSIGDAFGFKTEGAQTDPAIHDRLTRLEKIIASDDGKPLQVSLKVGEKDLATTMLHLTRQGFRLA